MKAVAYDEKGAVLNWNYGAASPPAGSAPQAMSTELTIEQNVAAIEPRWSGQGPAEAIMQQIELERE